MDEPTRPVNEAGAECVAPAGGGPVIGVGYTVVSSHDSGVVVWATANNGMPSRVTDAAGKFNMAAGEVLITVLGWGSVPAGEERSHATPQLQCIGSCVVAVSSGPATTLEVAVSPTTKVKVVCTHRVRDVTSTRHNEQDECARKAAVSYKNWLRHVELKFVDTSKAYCPPQMVEVEWAFGGSFAKAPALSGWPQLGRLSFDPLIYWPRAVMYACMLTGADVDAIINTQPGTIDHAVGRVLLSSTLTAYSGNYPSIPETVDDRSLGGIKLGLNRDCDDMAISACAVFNYMKSLALIKFSENAGVVKEHGKALAMLAERLHAYLRTFNTAACIICRAVAHVADPNVPTDEDSVMCGHVFATISKCPPTANGDCSNLLKEGVVIESTRQSSPFESAVETIMLNGKKVFRRQHTYNPSEQGIRCLKPLITRQYPQCIAAYTSTDSYLLTQDKAIGVPIAALLSGAAGAVRIPCPEHGRYNAAVNDLCHRPCYEDIDDAIAKFKWSEKLGLKPVSTLRGGQDQPDWDITGDPVILGSRGVGLTKFTVYGFSTVAECGGLVDACL
tara:strand:+ start:1740 stop:3416 length:1677 start_codon:yes stop_codon:yes gene_type:complete